MVHYFPVNRLGYRVDFTARCGIYRIEQRGKGIAQTEAAAATVADVEHPLQFLEELLLVVELGVLPIDGVTRGRL